MKRLSLLLLFILLGTTLAQANNTKPKAVISNNKGTYVLSGAQHLTLDARASYDLDGGGIASYRWYLNGSSTHSSTSTTWYSYYPVGTHEVKLKVTDHEGSTDELTVTIVVKSSVAGTKYYITDHLGSVRSTVNHLGQVVGQEDFWAYGLTMPGRSWNNGNAYDRYKFTGVERDSEGGLDLDAFGQRNYDPELGMFLGVDRFHFKYPHKSSYHYSLGNPVLFKDINGDSVDVSGLSEQTQNWLKTQLNTITGLNLYVDKNGLLVNDQSKKIRTEGTSEAARDDLLFAMNSETSTVSVVPMQEQSENTSHYNRRDNQIELNLNYIKFAEDNSVNVSSLTKGIGMTFFHELNHSSLGFRKMATPLESMAMHQVNLYRSQLGAEKFGHRASHGWSKEPGSGRLYIPFSTDHTMRVYGN